MKLAKPLVALALSAVLAKPAGAQERSRIWLGLGLGGGGGGDVEGASVMGQAAFQKKGHHLAVRALVIVQPVGESSNSGEIGVLYGRMALRSWGHAGIAAGLAHTNVTPCPDGTSPSCHTLGVPIVAEAAARLNSVLGVGLQAFVNLNSKTSYRGGLLFLQLGWIP